MEGAPRQCPTPVEEWGCQQLLTVTPSVPGELYFILQDTESPPMRQSGPPRSAHLRTRNWVQRVTELLQVGRAPGAKQGLEPRAAA